MNIFKVGSTRPIYLPHLPFLKRNIALLDRQRSLDIKGFELVLTANGAERVAQMGFNLALLPYADGFPAEVVQKDLPFLQTAVRFYHEHNIKIVATMLVSSAVRRGSYQNRDWYAVDTNGRTLLSAPRRYFVVPDHPDWQTELSDRIRELHDIGIDGICLQVESFGAIGLDLPSLALGPLGSYDERMHAAFEAAFPGRSIPQSWSTARASVRNFLRWRADLMNTCLQSWANICREHNADFPVFVQIPNPFEHNLLLNRGVNLAQLFDHSITVLTSAGSWTAPDHMIHDANKMAALLSQAPNAHGIVLGSNIADVAHDRLYPTLTYQRLLADSIAMHTPTVVPGTAVRHNGELSCLLHKRYASQQSVLEQMNHWMAQHHTRFQNARNVAPLAICFAPSATTMMRREHWVVGQLLDALSWSGFPLRLVHPDDDWAHVKYLILPGGGAEPSHERLSAFKANGGKILSVGKRHPLADDVLPLGRSNRVKLSWLPRLLRPAMPAINRLIGRALQMYLRWRYIRVIVRPIGGRLRRRQTRRAEPEWPSAWHQILHRALEGCFPKLEAETPLLFTVFSEQETDTVHLMVVNRGQAPVKVTLMFDDLVQGVVSTPGTDEPGGTVVGSAFMITIEATKMIQIPAMRTEGQTS